MASPGACRKEPHTAQRLGVVRCFLLAAFCAPLCAVSGVPAPVDVKAAAATPPESSWKPIAKASLNNSTQHSAGAFSAGAPSIGASSRVFAKAAAASAASDASAGAAVGAFVNAASAAAAGSAGRAAARNERNAVRDAIEAAVSKAAEAARRKAVATPGELLGAKHPSAWPEREELEEGDATLAAPSGVPLTSSSTIARPATQEAPPRGLLGHAVRSRALRSHTVRAHAAKAVKAGSRDDGDEEDAAEEAPEEDAAAEEPEEEEPAEEEAGEDHAEEEPGAEEPAEEAEEPAEETEEPAEETEEPAEEAEEPAAEAEEPAEEAPTDEASGAEEAPAEAAEEEAEEAVEDPDEEEEEAAAPEDEPLKADDEPAAEPATEDASEETGEEAEAEAEAEAGPDEDSADAEEAASGEEEEEAPAEEEEAAEGAEEASAEAEEIPEEGEEEAADAEEEGDDEEDDEEATLETEEEEPEPRDTRPVRGYEGIYRLRQKATGRYLDAFEYRHTKHRPGFEVVTRALQSAPVRDGVDRTQYWVIAPDDGGTYSVMHYTSGRFLEALGGAEKWMHDWVCVTKVVNMSEDCLEQRWYIQAKSGGPRNEVHFIQASSHRHLQAYPTKDHDFQATVQPLDPTNPEQVWILEKVYDGPLPIYDGLYIIQQKATGRQLDAYDDEETMLDSFCVTRDSSFSDTQHFLVRRAKGEVYTITQESSGRIVGADPNPPYPRLNYTAVTRDYQGDDSQKWLLIRHNYDEFTLLHVASGRMLDAYTHGERTRDWRAYTTLPTLASFDGNISSQVWRFRKIAPMPLLNGIYRIHQESSGRYIDAQGTGGGPGTAPKKDDDAGQLWDIKNVAADIYQITEHGRTEVLGAREWLKDGIVTQEDSLVHLGAVMPLEKGGRSQLWYAIPAGEDSYNFMQHASGRFLDATLTRQGRSQLVAHHPTGGNSQVWILDKVSERCPIQIEVCPPSFECGSVPDLCGGQVVCGHSEGSCAGWNPLSGEPDTCSDQHRCECTPKDECDDPESCGMEDDGCGGKVWCGNRGLCAVTNPITGRPHKCSKELPTLDEEAKAEINRQIADLRAEMLRLAGLEEYEDAAEVQKKIRALQAQLDEAARLEAEQAAGPGTCSCVPKDYCDADSEDECVDEEDGCGGHIQCGKCGPEEEPAEEEEDEKEEEEEEAPTRDEEVESEPEAEPEEAAVDADEEEKEPEEEEEEEEEEEPDETAESEEDDEPEDEEPEEEEAAADEEADEEPPEEEAPEEEASSEETPEKEAIADDDEPSTTEAAEPADEAAEPAEEADEPADGADEPAEEAEEPTEEADDPEEAEEPAGDADEPADEEEGEEPAAEGDAGDEGGDEDGEGEEEAAPEEGDDDASSKDEDPEDEAEEASVGEHAASEPPVDEAVGLEEDDTKGQAKEEAKAEEDASGHLPLEHEALEADNEHAASEHKAHADASASMLQEQQGHLAGHHRATEKALAPDRGPAAKPALTAVGALRGVQSAGETGPRLHFPSLKWLLSGR